MTRRAIVDTGPLIAVLDRSEQHHAWATERLEKLDAPMLVCEPVMAEAMFLLSRIPAAQDALLGLLEKGALQIAFHLGENLAEVRTLLRKYHDIPMSLADACVVRMAEIFRRHCVFTLDSDFIIYRKKGNHPLDLICPQSS